MCKALGLVHYCSTEAHPLSGHQRARYLDVNSNPGTTYSELLRCTVIGLGTDTGYSYEIRTREVLGVCNWQCILYCFCHKVCKVRGRLVSPGKDRLPVSRRSTMRRRQLVLPPSHCLEDRVLFCYRRHAAVLFKHCLTTPQPIYRTYWLDTAVVHNPYPRCSKRSLPTVIAAYEYSCTAVGMAHCCEILKLTNSLDMNVFMRYLSVPGNLGTAYCEVLGCTLKSIILAPDEVLGGGLVVYLIWL